MASIFDIEYETPEDVIANEQQQIQQMSQSSDPGQVFRAAGARALNNLVPSPAKRKAMATERKLQEILQNTPKKPGEDEYDYQIRVQTEIRNQMASINPEMALSANDKIFKTNTAKAQQQKLLVTNQQEDEKLKDALYTGKLGRRKVVFKVTPNGNIPFAMIPDGLDEEGQLKFMQKVQEENPNLTLDMGSGLELLELEGALSSGGLKTTAWMNKRLEGLSASKTFMRQSKRLVQNLESNLNSLAFGAGAAATAGGLAASSDLAREFFYKSKGLNDEEIKAKMAEDNEKFLRLVGDANVSSANLGRVKQLAYTLAKTLDPGGRLSDQDVEMAMEMIIGNGSPEVIANLVREKMEDAIEGSKLTLMMIKDGTYDGFGPSVKTFAEEFEKDAAAAQEVMLQFSNQVLARRGYRWDPEKQKAVPITDNPFLLDTPDTGDFNINDWEIVTDEEP